MNEVNLLIRSMIDRDEETGYPLYWSNEDGWVDKASATIFHAYSPYVPQFGVYEEV